MNAGEYELARELKEKIAARMAEPGPVRSHFTSDDLWELAKDIAELQIKVQRLLPTLPPPEKEPPPF